MFTSCIPAVHSYGFAGFCPPPARPVWNTPAFGMLTAYAYMNNYTFTNPFMMYNPRFYSYPFYNNSFTNSFAAGYTIGSAIGSLYSNRNSYNNYNNYNSYSSFYPSYTNSFVYNSASNNPFGWNNIPMPSFNSDFFTKLTSYTPSVNTSSYFNSITNSTKSSSSVLNVNSSNWKSYGYNASKGSELASYALSHACGWTGYCAKYVKNAIAGTGLGSYEPGHARDMVGIMRHNPNFKEISTNINLKSLPAGCIIVYGSYVSGYGSYGHVEITTGDGRAVSDGITNNLKKRPSAIFMPVSA